MLQSVIKHSVEVVDVPFDKKKEGCQFLCHKYLCMLEKQKKNEKETNPELFTSRKFTECLHACLPVSGAIFLYHEWLSMANKYLHFSCDEAHSLWLLSGYNDYCGNAKSIN